MDAATLALAMAAGGAAGYVLSHDGRNIEIPGLNRLLEFIRGSKPEILKAVSIDTSESRVVQEYPFGGDFLYVLNPDTPTSQVYIRLNEPESPEITLTELRVIKAPFYRFFITNTAGNGTLNIFVGKGHKVDLQPSAPAITKVELHRRYNGLIEDTINSPAIDTPYYFPVNGATGQLFDAGEFAHLAWYIYIPTTVGMTITWCGPLISFASTGAAINPLTGYNIVDANFVRGEWNIIQMPAAVHYMKFFVQVTGAAPSEIRVALVAKA